MLSRRPLLGLAATSLALEDARAQGRFPDRPVRLVIPFSPGGGPDVWGRMVAAGMGAELGQPVIVENRPGAAGLIGTEYVARAPADGHTLLFTIGIHVQTPVVMRRFPYHPVDDFAPIGRLGTIPVVFVVGPAVPATVTTLAEFAAWGQGRDLSFGSYAAGSTGHAYALMLAQEARLAVTHVTYTGEGPMLQDLLGGRTHGGFHSTVAAGEMIRTGRLRPLAASSDARIMSLPDLPTLLELGYSNRFNFVGFGGVLAPARTPQPLLERLADAFRRFATSEETRQRLLATDAMPGYQDPDAFRAQIERNLREWTAIADDLNLTLDY